MAFLAQRDPRRWRRGVKFPVRVIATTHLGHDKMARKQDSCPRAKYAVPTPAHEAVYAILKPYRVALTRTEDYSAPIVATSFIGAGNPGPLASSRHARDRKPAQEQPLRGSLDIGECVNIRRLHHRRESVEAERRQVSVLFTKP